MTEELKQYVNTHKATFEVWRDTNQSLQPSNDLLKPLIVEFAKVHPEHNLNGSCRECLIDMLRWALIEAKKETKPKKSKGVDI